jgi:protein FRA10AC1
MLKQSDVDALKEVHEFLREDDGLGNRHGHDWRDRMAKKYENKLFKDFVVLELSSNKTLGIRWRTEAEVINGKGEFICSNKACAAAQSLSTVELPFGYKEKGATKFALVKAVVCPDCLGKLKTYSTS